MARNDESDPQASPGKRQKTAAVAETRCTKAEESQFNLPPAGVAKVSENSLMIQAAAQIQALEIEINSAADHLEKLKKLQTSNGITAEELNKELSLEDQNADTSSAHEGPHLVPAGQQAEDGCVKLRAVLPQPTKSRGTKLLALGLQYMTELQQEKDQLKSQITEHKRCSAAPTRETNSAPEHLFNHHTAAASQSKACFRILDHEKEKNQLKTQIVEVEGRNGSPCLENSSAPKEHHSAAAASVPKAFLQINDLEQEKYQHETNILEVEICNGAPCLEISSTRKHHQSAEATVPKASLRIPGDQFSTQTTL